MKFCRFLSCLVCASLAGFTLVGCSALSKSTAQALPTVVLGEAAEPSSPTQAAPQAGKGGVTASGVVVPAQEARLAFALAGIVETVDVKVGDQVQANQVLARLAGSAQLQAGLSRAELEVLTAQQALKDLQEPHPLLIAQAQVALEQAKTSLDNLLHPPETAVQQAQKAILDAQEVADDAQKYVNGLKYGRGSLDQIAAAQATYVVAQAEVDRLQKVYERTSGDPAEDAAKALALSNLEAAKTKRDRALANLNWLKGKPTQLEIDQKNNDLALAKAQLADAQKALDELLNPAPEDVALAQASVADTHKTLDDLKAGPDPDEMALFQARLKSAQDQVEAARLNLANLELKAPFAGSVGELSIHAGEWVIPGQPVLTLADLARLRIETTDLSERDVPKITDGQPVAVYIKALNQDATGRVVEIAPLATSLGGDVVYKTTIELDNLPAGLRAGMSAEVVFKTSD